MAARLFMDMNVLAIMGKRFKCLKFRSMVMNSQEVLDDLLRTDPAAKAEWDKDFKLKTILELLKSEVLSVKLALMSYLNYGMFSEVK